MSIWYDLNKKEYASDGKNGWLKAYCDKKINAFENDLNTVSGSYNKHISGAASRHSAKDIDYSSSETLKEKLDNSIDHLTNQIISESNIRKIADENLKSSIISESETIKTDIGKLPNLKTDNKSDIVTAINEEHSKRIAGDLELFQAIAETTATEVEIRKTDDAKLQSNIELEAVTRKTADAKLQSNIELEAETRKTVDDELFGEIDKLNNVFDENDRQDEELFELGDTVLATSIFRKSLDISVYGDGWDNENENYIKNLFSVYKRSDPYSYYVNYNGGEAFGLKIAGKEIKLKEYSVSSIDCTEDEHFYLFLMATPNFNSICHCDVELMLDTNVKRGTSYITPEGNIIIPIAGFDVIGGQIENARGLPGDETLYNYIKDVARLSNLNTKYKTDIVGAINEVNGYSKNSCVTIASVTSSKKAKSIADFIIQNDETILDKMQIAFNAVPSTGGEIHLCAGTYDFSIYCASVEGGSEANLQIPYNEVTVSGEGAGTVFAHNRNDSDITFINAFNKTGIHVKDIKFMVGDFSRGVGVRNCTYSTVSNCMPVMQNTDGYQGILVSGGANNRIINNICIGNEFSTVIRVESSRHCIVEGNLIEGDIDGNLICVTKSTDILISGNLLQVGENDVGVYVDSTTTGSVMHNHIVNNNGNAISGNGANLYVNNQVVTV